MAETTNYSEWPTRSEAARRLNLSAAMIDVLVGQGRLRFFPTRLGKLIDPSSLERLRREREANHAGAAK